MQYWLDLFTTKSWQEFIENGACVSGFSEKRWSTVQKLKNGDRLICYVTGISRVIGMLEVDGDPFQDSTPIWSDNIFPSRVRVKVLLTLTLETAIPILSLRERLQVFRDLKNPLLWSGAFRGSPASFSNTDGETILQAIKDAKARPVERSLDPRKVRYRAKNVTKKKEEVKKIDNTTDEAIAHSSKFETSGTIEHLEIQWLLLKIGSELGLDVWAARNDRNREFRGMKLSDIPNMKDRLPQQFDNETNRTIENIDVLWLKGNSYQAAFEIEKTTSIYSGLLRMSDLLAMQPNLEIPIFIVAPDEKREKVMSEITRPTFRKLETPLHEVCRFISFSGIKGKYEQVKQVLRHLKIEFLEDIAEAVEFTGE